jgi:hypothetical protein
MRHLTRQSDARYCFCDKTQEPKLVRIEMVDDKAGDLLDPPRLRGFPETMPFHNRAVGRDQDRPAKTKPIEAGRKPRALFGVAATDVARCRLETLGRRHLILQERRKVVAAARRRVRGDFGKSPLGRPASARLGRDRLLNPWRREGRRGLRSGWNILHLTTLRMMDVRPSWRVAVGPSEGLSIRLKFSGHAAFVGARQLFGEPTNPHGLCGGSLRPLHRQSGKQVRMPPGTLSNADS